MKLLNNILFMEWADMIQAGIPKGTLDSARNRKSNNWKFQNDETDSRKILIDYEALTTKHKESIVNHFGNPYNYVARQPIKDLVKWDNEAEKFYMAYRYDGIKTLSTDDVKKYTIAANWLNMLNQVSADKRSIKKLLNISVTDFFINVMEIFKDKKENISLPSSYKRLSERMKDYKAKGYLCLIPEWRYNNNFAAKVKDELAESVLLTMCANGNQFDDVFIAGQYNKWALENQYKPITAMTVGIHRRKNNHNIIAEREGNEGLREKYLKQAKGFRPSFPLALVESDDNHLDLQFIDIDTGNKFTRYKAIVVMDSFNDYVLGYAYTTESVTIELVKTAIANAMYYIRSITGAWHLPHEMKADNFGIGSLEPYYKEIGNFIVTPVGSKHRGYIEQFFGSPLWKTAMKIGANNYTGNNITARNRGVNTELVNQNINNRPVLGTESETQVEQFFHRLRHMTNAKGVSKHEQWITAWNNLPADKKREITDEQFLLKFGILHNNDRTIQITNKGVNPQINNVRYSYDLAQYNLEHIGKSVNIIYDPYDMSRVLVTDFDKVRMMAYEPHLNSRALADAEVNSRTYLNSILAEKKDAVIKISAKAKRRKELLEQNSIDAEAILVSGVMIKEIKQSAEQKYLGSSPQEDTNRNIFDSL